MEALFVVSNHSYPVSPVAAQIHDRLCFLTIMLKKQLTDFVNNVFTIRAMSHLRVKGLNLCIRYKLDALDFNEVVCTREKDSVV